LRQVFVPKRERRGRALRFGNRFGGVVMREHGVFVRCCARARGCCLRCQSIGAQRHGCQTLRATNRGVRVLTDTRAGYSASPNVSARSREPRSACCETSNKPGRFDAAARFHPRP
jgi:hypothetical protein